VDILSSQKGFRSRPIVPQLSGRRPAPIRESVSFRAQKSPRRRPVVKLARGLIGHPQPLVTSASAARCVRRVGPPSSLFPPVPSEAGTPRGVEDAVHQHENAERLYDFGPATTPPQFRPLIRLAEAASALVMSLYVIAQPQAPLAHGAVRPRVADRVSPVPSAPGTAARVKG